LYPLTERLRRWDVSENLQEHEEKKERLGSGVTIRERYIFYGMKRTRATPVREYLKVVRGLVQISSGETSYTLGSGEGAAYYTNIPHEIRALEDAEIVRYMPRTGLAPHYFST
jgi:hypothetical protein